MTQFIWDSQQTEFCTWPDALAHALWEAWSFLHCLEGVQMKHTLVAAGETFSIHKVIDERSHSHCLASVLSARGWWRSVDCFERRCC